MSESLTGENTCRQNNTLNLMQYKQIVQCELLPKVLWAVTAKLETELGNIINLEKLILTRKHRYLFGNIDINFEISEFIWKHLDSYKNITNNLETSLLKVMFPQYK